jgi:hypothetical protein
VTALLLLRRFWPVLVAILAFAGLMAWHRSAVRTAYDKGTTTERAAWETEAARLRAIAATEALARAAAVTAANDAATRSQASLDALAAAERTTHESYYRNRPAVRCLDPDRVRAIAKADAANSAASAAK